MDESRREALLEEYRQVVGTFRLLTDIRFKLLALLPVATAVAVALRADGEGDVVGALESLALFAFGLLVTAGLLTYNTRNDQLYDSLVGRAAAIERSLGLPDGAFANRPHEWLTYGRGRFEWPVGHRSSVALIYAASIGLWLFGCLASVGLLGWELLFNPDSETDAPAEITAAAGALAFLVTAAGARRIQQLRDAKDGSMRVKARQAVDEARGIGLPTLGREALFLKRCAQLAQIRESTVRKRALFLAELDPDSQFHYLPRRSDETVRASALVALLTDLAPEWIYDCATERRGSVAPLTGTAQWWKEDKRYGRIKGDDDRVYHASFEHLDQMAGLRSLEPGQRVEFCWLGKVRLPGRRRAEHIRVTEHNSGER